MCEFTLLLLPSRFSGFDALLKGTFTSVGCLVAILEERGELLALTVMGVFVCFKMHLFALGQYFILCFFSSSSYCIALGIFAALLLFWVQVTGV